MPLIIRYRCAMWTALAILLMLDVIYGDGGCGKVL
jgi:hypothetical protein